MNFREYLSLARKEGILKEVNVPVSKNLEMAAILKKMEPTPVLFNNVKDSEFKVVGNLFGTKDVMARALGVKRDELIGLLARTIDERSPPELVKDAPCQEVTMEPPDLSKLPILKHFEMDAGPYITSAVVVTRDDEWGQNVSFHRALPINKTHLVMRVVKGRHFHKYLEKNGELDAVFCVGVAPSVLIAGATSVDINVNELEIANALSPLQVVKAKTADIEIPANCEFVIEGRAYIDELHEEGPFVDLTETLDIVRQEPVFEVKKITHRKDPLWHALLPGGLEHKILMGMPREPTIFKKVVEKGVECLDVNINPGGCSWLHAIVKIRKKYENDGKLAIDGAFEGHRSLKHCFVVDEDIDIYDPASVEWAFATRFQGDRDLVIKDKEPGSSLDPSAEPNTKLTTKMGFDLTMPVDKNKRLHYLRVPYKDIDLSKYFEN